MAAGQKTGGRKKGSLNRKTVERQRTVSEPAEARTAGRPAGSPNKATTERKSQMSEAVAAVLGGMTRKAIDAMTPRDVIHLVMMQGLKAGDLKIAFMAAAELAPYAHPRLSAVTVAATADPDLATLSDAEIDARIAKLTAKPARGALH